MNYRGWLLTVTLALCTAENAYAQPTTLHAQADESFRQAREAAAHGDDRLALQLFRASHELEASRGTLLNIAICEEKLGLVTAAMQHFQEVLPQFAPGDERLALVQQHISDLVPRVPHLRVNVAIAAPAGTRVTFDGAPLAATRLGAEMAVDPGKHVITVNATGLPERRYDVVVEEGKALALTVEPGAIAPPKLLPRLDTPPPTSHRTQVGIIVGSAGIVALTVGGVAGVLALADRDAIESECPTRVGCSPEILDRARSGKSLSIVSALSLSAGAIGVGAGMYLVLSSGKSRGTATAATTAGLTLLSDGGRLGIRGSF